MIIQSKFYSRIWSKSIVVSTVLLSIILSYCTYEFIDIKKLSTVVDLFSFLPFTATAYIGGIIYISSSISSLKGLSIAERVKINASVSSRRKLYTIVGAFNLLIGLSVILLYIFSDLTLVLGFSIACAVYLAILTIILCAIEQWYLNLFKQYINDRKTKQDEKKKLLSEYPDNNHVHA